MIRIAEECNGHKHETRKGGDKKRRLTFHEMLEQGRIQSAHRLWQKAINASHLRHLVLKNNDQKSAFLLSKIKNGSAKKAIYLAPEKIRFDIDDVYHIGLLNVSWLGNGRLYMPYPEGENTDVQIKYGVASIKPWESYS